MRKPISKHSLRRAMERAQAENLIQWTEPTGAVVDRLWHEIEKDAYGASRKKPTSRETVRDPALVDGAISSDGPGAQA